MAYNTFADLVNGIVDFAPEIQSSDPVTAFIAMAEDEIFPFIKHYLAETQVTLTSSGNAVVLPDDFLYTRFVYVDGVKATPVSPYGARLYPGQIGYYQSGNTYVILPSQDAPRTVGLDYYARPQRISASNPSNWLLTRFPTIYLYGALAQGYYWRGNTDAYNAAKAKVQDLFGAIHADHSAGTSGGNQITSLPTGGYPYAY